MSNNKMNDLKTYIKNREFVLLFRDFLHQNYNSENLAFWFEIEEFKTLPNPSKVCSLLYEKYFSSDSKYELNLPNHILKEIQQDIKQPEKCTNETFTKAQNEIWSLLQCDCFPKFVDTDLFKDFLNKNPEILLEKKKSKFNRLSFNARNRADTVIFVDKFLSRKK